MSKRKRYTSASLFDGKFIIFDGIEWIDLEEAARQEMEELNHEETYKCAV